MNLAKRTGYSCWRGCAVAVIVASFCTGLLADSAAAQGVDIDMPPPPKAKVQPTEPAAQAHPSAAIPSATAKLSQMQHEGRTALSRFAHARYSGYWRTPLDRRRNRYRSYHYGYYNSHIHFPFFHTFHFGFCW